MKTKFNLKWRTTTALCIVSTMAVATAGYSAHNGLSSWDLRSHPNPFLQLVNNIENTIAKDLGNNKGNGNGSNSTGTVKTASPIKHVIILIGENRGLDHTFGIYKPKGAGQTISNLLSKGIVNADGTPGPNFHLSQQFSVLAQKAWYFGAPKAAKSPYGGANV